MMLKNKWKEALFLSFQGLLVSLAVILAICFLLALPFIFGTAYQFIVGPTLETMTISKGTLTWGDKVYTPYTPFMDSNMSYKVTNTYSKNLFGKIEGEKDTYVYRCEGQDPEKWLIFVREGIMRDQFLYKEKSVTEIPEAFYER